MVHSESTGRDVSPDASRPLFAVCDDEGRIGSGASSGGIASELDVHTGRMRNAGFGNVLYVEPRLVYLWHSTISQQIAHWR